MTLVMKAPMAIAQQSSMSMSMAADMTGSVRPAAARHHQSQLANAGLTVAYLCSLGVCPLA
jgi:hypothetical protein